MTEIFKRGPFTFVGETKFAKGSWQEAAHQNGMEFPLYSAHLATQATVAVEPSGEPVDDTVIEDLSSEENQA